ncbi:suppressor of fused domain protein [Mycolicibacterium houstonense]|uniref:suppressor of fused domain protein n=1 Tax=Mycolicibacterium houstonense TaxID=146021 RepID=UPI00082DAE5D|nr:suppressor of fused domain protein [Mycolicibacterium houstonense]MCV7067055.1 suppressor of fused domain protein [Mycolicibacterium farcinogenes]
MGLFGRKRKDEPAEPPATDVAATEDDDSAPGWDAITAAFAALYPEQPEPLHMGTLIKWSFGGPDPLDGISIYRAPDALHFVTYGFSDLYTKESTDPEHSGFGFELTLKLRPAPGADEDQEMRTACVNLQGLARYVFESGMVFEPGEYIYTGQEAGIDAGHASALTGFLTTLDTAGEIDTPHGRVTFVQLVGATDAELRAIVDKRHTATEMLELIGSDVTDLGRASVV